MDVATKGSVSSAPSLSQEDLHAAVNLRLALLDLPLSEGDRGGAISGLVSPILARQRERAAGFRIVSAPPIRGFRIFSRNISPIPARQRPRCRDARWCSIRRGWRGACKLPHDADSFKSPLLSSYRLRNGVLHNPAKDRRTTAGVFHIVEGGCRFRTTSWRCPKWRSPKLLSLR